MGLFSKDIKSMEDLFLHTLQDVYYAENQIVKSLPKMIEKATNRELATGLRNHLSETENQVSRLEQVFEAIGETPRGTDCPAMDGLLKEADNVRSMTRRCWTRPSSAARKPLSTMKSRVTALLSPGPRSSATTMSFAS